MSLTADTVLRRQWFAHWSVASHRRHCTEMTAACTLVVSHSPKFLLISWALVQYLALKKIGLFLKTKTKTFKTTSRVMAKWVKDLAAKASCPEFHPWNLHTHTYIQSLLLLSNGNSQRYYLLSKVRKTHPKCGQHHWTGWGSGQNVRKMLSPVIYLYFPTVDTMWPAASLIPPYLLRFKPWATETLLFS